MGKEKQSLASFCNIKSASERVWKPADCNNEVVSVHHERSFTPPSLEPRLDLIMGLNGAPRCIWSHLHDWCPAELHRRTAAVRRPEPDEWLHFLNWVESGSRPEIHGDFSEFPWRNATDGEVTAPCVCLLSSEVSTSSYTQAAPSEVLWPPSSSQMLNTLIVFVPLGATCLSTYKSDDSVLVPVIRGAVHPPPASMDLKHSAAVPDVLRPPSSSSLAVVRLDEWSWAKVQNELVMLLYNAQ